MAERPGTPGGRSRVSMLAERFGMTTEEVEELLRSTREEYSQQNQVPPVVVVQAAPEAASAENTPPSSSGPPVSGVFVAVLFTILLIALGVALSLHQGWFRQRRDRQQITRVDTVQKLHIQANERPSTQQKSSDTLAGDVPADLMGAPHDESPAPAKTPKSAQPHKTSIKKHSQSAGPKPALTTSSNFEAEERLADMRADGNTKAHIKTTKKGGSVKYQVFSK